MTDPYADDASRAQGFARRVSRGMDRWHRWVKRHPSLAFAYKVLVTIVGVLIILAGIIMLVTPGPGWVTIFIGLMVLGTEYHWARRLLGWLRQRLARIWERTQLLREARKQRKEVRRRARRAAKL